jgi:dolichol-phosphate mannosyltransferase
MISPYRDKNNRVIFVGLPAYNEEVAIKRLLGKLEILIGRGEPLKILVYNDGSTDRTGAVASEWAAKLPLTLLGHTQNRGLGAGLRSLVSHARIFGAPNDVLVTMDCDDTHDPEQIPSMVQPIRLGYDIVIASRFRAGALSRGVPPFRRFTALGVMALLKSFHPMPGVLDYSCGFRAYRVGLLHAGHDAYGEDLITEDGFACMVELLLKLSTLGPKITEVPLVLRYDLKPSPSKMNVGNNIAKLLKLIILWKLRGSSLQKTKLVDRRSSSRGGSRTC